MTTHTSIKFDQYLDRQTIELHEELARLQQMDSKIHIYQSPLFKILNEHVQDEIKHLPNRKNQIDYLFQIFNREEYNDTNMNMFRYIQGQQDYNFAKLSKLTSEFMNTSEFCMQYGTDTLVGLIINVLFLRYKKELEIGDFLMCYRLEYQSEGVSYEMKKCLLMSRLNYIFHGVYLPIIYFRYDGPHVNVSLYVPVIDNDLPENNNVKWRIIYIDSDINSESLKHNELVKLEAHTEPHAIMKWFSEQLQYEQKNVVNYEFSYCTEQIQQVAEVGESFGLLKSSGNCAIWAHLLGFQILANANTLHQKTSHFDFVSVYCKNFFFEILSKPSMSKKFIKYSKEFKIAMYAYVIDLVNRVKQMHRSKSAILNEWILHEILYGDLTALVEILIGIFKKMNNDMQEFMWKGENYNAMVIRQLNRRIGKLKRVSKKVESSSGGIQSPEHISHREVFADLVEYEEPSGRNWDDDDSSEPDYDAMFPEDEEETEEETETETEDETEETEETESNKRREQQMKKEKRNEKRKEKERQYWIRKQERDEKIEKKKIQDKNEKADRLLNDIKSSKSAKRHKH
jgi:hypothetical protein